MLWYYLYEILDDFFDFYGDTEDCPLSEDLQEKLLIYISSKR